MTDRPQFHTTAGVRSAEEGLAASPEQVLWRQLTEARGDGEFCTAWLGLLSRMIDGVISGMVVLGPADKGPFVPAGFWPPEGHEHGHLAAVTERALQERKGIIIKCDSAEAGGVPAGVSFHAAFPVRSQGRLCGAVAVELAPRPHEQLQTVMRQLQWSSAWLENRVLTSEIEQNALSKHRIVAALDLAAVALQEERFRPSATGFATHLATRLRCDRVSVGFLKGKHIKVRAISHSAQFKKQMNLVRAIGAAMDESVDQEAVLVYPDPAGESNRVLRSHAELVRQHGDGAICTIPFLAVDGKGYGALTLERSFEEPFTSEEVQLGESIAALVAPVLEEKRRNDRLIIEKIGESLRLQFRKLFGPMHTARKAVAASAALLVLFFSVATWTYRVTAKTTIEGTVQRAVAAPFNGFIAEANVRAGDTVSKGQVMCVLDNRDMVLERVKWASQREQYQRQYREAMATANRASMRILREQINQANAQIALLDEQLARSSMTAPFDGIVVRGDLSQSLGAPVERGQVLFEVAPLEGYRIKLQVDERDIGWIQLGQTGVLLLNSLPNESFPIRIETITSVSTASEGQNYFLVEAGLEQMTDQLRPGMEGVGKVEIGRRKLIWVLTHKLVDWVRLWVWSWWP